MPSERDYTPNLLYFYPTDSKRYLEDDTYDIIDLDSLPFFLVIPPKSQKIIYVSILKFKDLNINPFGR